LTGQGRIKYQEALATTYPAILATIANGFRTLRKRGPSVGTTYGVIFTRKANFDEFRSEIDSGSWQYLLPSFSTFSTSSHKCPHPKSGG